MYSLFERVYFKGMLWRNTFINVVQTFSIKLDLRCGSTVGPIIVANLGVCTVDVGNSMLSMHSIREIAGSKDQENLICIFKEFFKAG